MKTKNSTIETSISNNGHKARKGGTMKGIITILALMATTFAFATPATAADKPIKFCKPDGDCKSGADKIYDWQEDWTTCPVDCDVPGNLPKVDFLDPIEREIIFRHGERTAFDLAVNAFGFKDFEKWMKTYAPEGFEDVFKKFTKNKKKLKKANEEAADFIAPAGKTFGYFRLSDSGMTSSRTSSASTSPIRAARIS
jgi:hypothetical protein